MSRLQDLPSAPQSVLAVIVLYKMRLDDSVSLRTLREAARGLDERLSLKILVYDNTPTVQSQPIAQDLLYIASDRNAGLSAAYNEAGRIAGEMDARWLLTLDQDTTLPDHFLSRLSCILDEIAEDHSVAGVVPRLQEGDRVLSPHWYPLDFFKRAFPAGFSGVPRQSVYAFNSGAVIRLDALWRVGGYSEVFWLDFSDMYLFRQLHHHHYRMFVAGDLVLQHQLSLLETSTRMSDARFRNILEAASAFYDTMRSPVSGVAFTLGLAKSYVANIVLRKGKSYRQTLVAMLKLRVFHGKSYRVRRFEEHRSVASARPESSAQM